MSLFMAISPEPTGTRVLVTDRDEVKLKARLGCPPAHPRALSWLLEAVALWEGSPVRAVLRAGGRHATCAATFRADWFTDFGGPLYTLDVIDGSARGRSAIRDRLTGLGPFRDMKQLCIDDALKAHDQEARR